MYAVAPPPASHTPFITTSPPGREPRPLIGDFIRRPAWLWLTHVAPIALLLAWTSRSYAIISTDFSSAERSESVALALALAVITAGAGVLALRVYRARRLLSHTQAAALLTMSLAVLSATVFFTWSVIPDMEPLWLVNRWELLSEGFCLGMPGAFYAILLLSTPPLRRHGGVEFALLIAAMICGAAIMYGITAGLTSIDSHLDFPDWAWVIFVTTGVLCGGTLITALITRAALIACTATRRTHPFLQRCFLFLVACAGPIGGLYLNKTLAFPVDFQAPLIYILALVNGGLLVLPALRSIAWHRVIWLAQCALFPFSAYFFLVFLPWLPMSLFAMIACGAGFLMLVPLVLGISHAYRIIDGFREEVRDGPLWPVAVMGLCAVLALPALGLWSAWRDREALDEALTYLYSPDYRKDIIYPGSLTALASSLQHLRDARQGIFLPFLTPLYNQIVFHGLVLPDKKINELQTAFFGDTSAKQASVLLRSRTPENDWQWQDTPSPPDNNVALDDNVQVTVQRNGATSTAQLLLTMRNLGTNGAEFSTTVHLAEDVYVTGFALKIGTDFVPAHIAEKKAALWVYEKISEAHRDPGILAYLSRTDLSLKISPFAPNETRQARLDLVYPSNGQARIGIGEKIVQLGDTIAPPAPVAVTSCVTASASLAIANVVDPANWRIRRTPYLDILIDCSRDTHYTEASLASAIRQARQAFPEARLARVTAINFEARDLEPNLVPLAQLSAADLSANLLPSRGGLLQDRFLKRGLLLAHDLMQIGTEQALLRPQFVLISSHGEPGARENRLDDFLRLVPDARVILAEDTNGMFNAEDLASREHTSIDAEPFVTLWRWDNHYAVSAAAPREVLSFPGGPNATGLEIYDPQRGQFAATATSPIIPPDSRFADGVRTWAAQDDAIFNPRLLKDGAAALIGLSKRTGILVPDSSYIAVESMAQWRALEQKEQLKLANKQVFELEEPVATPEPSTWLLILIGLLALGAKPTLRAARSGAKAVGGSGTRPCCRPRFCRGL
jgi:hypothetical protein